MAEGPDQLTRTRSGEADLDHEVDLEGDTRPGLGAGTRTGIDSGSGFRERVEALFSPRRFLLALALSTGGLFAGSAMIPIAGGLVGVLLGCFLAGLLGERRPITETAVAGATVVGTSTLIDHLVWTLIGIGAPIIAVGAAVGLVIGALGGYLGADLREGLTREI